MRERLKVADKWPRHMLWLQTWHEIAHTSQVKPFPSLFTRSQYISGAWGFALICWISVQIHDWGLLSYLFLMFWNGGTFHSTLDKNGPLLASRCYSDGLDISVKLYHKVLLYPVFEGIVCDASSSLQSLYPWPMLQVHKAEWIKSAVRNTASLLSLTRHPFSVL